MSDGSRVVNAAEPTDGPLNFASESATLLRQAGAITLVEESSFCLSDAYGDIEPDRPDGFFVGDTRILSTWRLGLAGASPELLGSREVDPFTAVFVLRVRLDGDGRDQLLVVRTRQLLHGALREHLTVRNLSEARRTDTLRLEVGADFAGLFSVKEGRPWSETSATRVVADQRGWRFMRPDGRGTELWFSEPVIDEKGSATFSLSIAPGEDWELTVDVAAIVGERRVDRAHPSRGPAFALSPSQRLNRWRRRSTSRQKRLGRVGGGRAPQHRRPGCTADLRSRRP